MKIDKYENGGDEVCEENGRECGREVKKGTERSRNLSISLDRAPLAGF
jgi:hypothetical protein